MSCKVIFYVKFYRAHYSGQTAQAQAGTLSALPLHSYDGSSSSSRPGQLSERLMIKVTAPAAPALLGTGCLTGPD